MADAFYPFVAEDAAQKADGTLEPRGVARVAVYDDPLATPRVVEIEPSDVRSYLETITETTNRLAHEQGSHIPFMVIREVVENLIHAYFAQPTVSILDAGDTIVFSDQGPGIADKDLARQYGTSSATEQMRRYIRGVGSGLPYVEAWLTEHGGTLDIRDNIAGGTMVTISLVRDTADEGVGTQDTPSAETTVYGVSQVAQLPYMQVPMGQPLYNPAIGQYVYPTAQSAFAAGVAAPVVPYPQPAAVPVAASVPGTVTAPQALALDGRESQALQYLGTHREVGPTDLTRALGGSNPTWTRVLQSLEGRGLVHKQGQKRALTDAGRAWLGQ